MDLHVAGVNNSSKGAAQHRRTASGGSSGSGASINSGVDTGAGGGSWCPQQKQSPGASHRDRSVSMNMNAPPSKKHRASDDENEQSSPSQRDKSRERAAADKAAAEGEVEEEGDVARPRRGAGASPGAIDDDDDDESSEGSLNEIPGANSKPRAFSLGGGASGGSSGITEESFMSWLVDQKNQGVGAGQMLDVLGLGVSDGVAIDDDELWEAMFSMGIRLIQPTIQSRQKLDHVNTLQDVANLLRSAKKVVILAGAGISVSCGIPDFRSENGIYSCMFDIEFFRTNPRPFFAFAKELFPKSNGFTFVPSRSHYFLKLLEEKGKLLRIYSQNIDMLEHAAGISHERSVLCHGSFATATCLSCKRTYPNDAIRDDVLNQRVPMCKECNAPDGIVKPDIVFFGESLPRRFHDSIKSDENEADLVLVMGSSLKVNPVRSIVGRIHKNTPMVLINREPVGRPHKFDVELLGYSDEIVEELCRLLEWEIPRPDPVLLGQSNLPESVLASMSALSTSRKESMPFEFIPPSRHMFNGALANSISSSDEEDGNSSSSEPGDDEESRAVVGMEDEESEQKVPRRWNEDVDEDHDHLMGSGNELLRNSSFEDISQHD